jgi:hypothetical protein
MRILDLLSSLCTRFLPSQTSVKPAPQVCAAPLTPPQSYPRPQPKPEPVAPLSAVAILDQEPDLTPAELATRAGVTLSYARSLVRRRNAKRSPAVVRPVAADTGVAVLQTQVRELARRVEQAESRDFRTSTPSLGGRRALVLDRSAAGVPVNLISEELGIPAGEAEFILKMDRLKKSLKN